MTDQKNFDQTRPSFFRGYGKTTMLSPHPAIHEEWSTTFRKTYLKPTSRTKPNAYTKVPLGEIEHDNALHKSDRRSTIASGFQANAQLFDETSWATEKNTHTDIVRTEYRNRYNQAKPFHKSTIVNSHGRMKRKEHVYDTHDTNPLRNWKAREADTQIYATQKGAEHDNKDGFKV